MFGSEILEVAIGVIFVFLLVSVICTAIREGMESFLKTRAAFLEHGIREMLHDRGAIGIARTFYNHPLIYSLYADEYTPRPGDGRPSPLAHGGKLPTYIPTRNFALALMDIAARGPTSAPGSTDETSPILSLQNVRANVLNIENASVQRILLTAIDTAQGDMDKAVANIAAWYDSGMDRISGAYKRATQKVLFFIGLFVAMALNVNPLTIADYLYHNDSARAAVVARAEAAARDSSYENGTKKYAAARAELDSLRLPIGWANAHIWLPDVHFPWSKPDTTAAAQHAASAAGPVKPWDDIFSPFIGWIITAMAATLGAPFWFDILNKFMIVRSTVKPHEKSPEEGSEDRQSTASKESIAKGDVGAQTHAVGAGAEAGQGTTGAPVGPPLVQPVASATPPGDAEATIDGCDVVASPEEHTSDEDLPAATGGVA